MSRARRFSKAEIRDAAAAAAESGLSVRLSITGDMEFFHQLENNRGSVQPTPEAALEGWLRGEVGGRA